MGRTAKAIGWKSPPWISLIAVYLCISALLAIAVLGIILFIDSRSAPPAETQYTAEAGVVAAESRVSRGSLGDDSTIFFLVEVTAWDVARKTVELTITCEVNVDGLSSSQRTAFLGSGLPVLIDGFAPAQNFMARASLGKAGRAGFTPCMKQTATGLAAGSPSAYPFDRYSSAIGVLPPEGTNAVVQVVPSPAWSDPFTLTVADIGDRAFFERTQPALAPFLLTATRAWTSTSFAFLVAVTPVFLLVVAFGDLFRASNARSQAQLLKRLPLEMGAAFLALLTLRQVLVPSAIDAPTLIDVVLAIELALFVFALVVAWRLRIRKDLADRPPVS